MQVVRAMFLKRLWYNESMLREVAKEGFTLVELSLAMAFVGVLSVAVVLIISNTVSAYRRGLTLSRVNMVGSDLVDDMRSSIQGSSAKSLISSCRNDSACVEDNAHNYVAVNRKTTVTINGTPYDDVPIYGAFCSGTYSYVWNSGYFRSDDATFDEKRNGDWMQIRYLDSESKEERYINGDTVGGNFFRLMKVRDEGRAICIAMSDGTDREKYGAAITDDIGETNKIDVTNIGGFIPKIGEAIDLLPEDGGNDLVLYDLWIAEPAISDTEDNVFYSVSFILGTMTGGVNVMAAGNSCAAPEDRVNDNYNYCAINKFNFAMQVNGG